MERKRLASIIIVAVILIAGAIAWLITTTDIFKADQSDTNQSANPVIVAAGDIACPAGKPVTSTTCQQDATAKLAASLKPEAVLVLGDLQYENATLAEFQSGYDKSWGALKDKTRPVPGNHEYNTPGAAGYFDYFGAAAGERGKGYYSYDIGAWHIIALNSETDVSEGSPQRQWLRDDLRQNAAPCTLAYWHTPLFTTGMHATETAYTGLWQELYDANAEIVLNGHSHSYERFVPQDPTGKADSARGITQFVVGTGGYGWQPLRDAVPNLAKRQNESYGVLKLELEQNSAKYSFAAIPGAPAFTDTGTVACH